MWMFVVGRRVKGYPLVDLRLIKGIVGLFVGK